MIKKIYLVAINWELINNSKERYRYVVSTEAVEGNDIAGFTEYYKYSDGWRIYSYTTKKARDSIVSQTLRAKIA